MKHIHTLSKAGSVPSVAAVELPFLASLIAVFTKGRAQGQLLKTLLTLL